MIGRTFIQHSYSTHYSKFGYPVANRLTHIYPRSQHTPHSYLITPTEFGGEIPRFNFISLMSRPRLEVQRPFNQYVDFDEHHCSTYASGADLYEDFKDVLEPIILSKAMGLSCLMVAFLLFAPDGNHGHGFVVVFVIVCRTPPASKQSCLGSRRRTLSGLVVGALLDLVV